MYSKTLAVFLLFCVTQGLVNGLKLTKTKLTKTNEEPVVEQIVKNLVDLTERFAHEDFQNKSKFCNLESNPILVEGLVFKLCEFAFNKYQSGGTCDEEIRAFALNFNESAAIAQDFIPKVREESEETMHKLIRDIHDAKKHSQKNLKEYQKCDEPKSHTPTGLELCNKELQVIVFELDGAMNSQCLAKNSLGTKSVAKNGTEYEPNLPQIMALFHSWLILKAKEVHNCTTVEGYFIHLEHAWESLGDHMTLQSKNQADKSACKNATENFIENCDEIAQLTSKYIENPLAVQQNTWGNESLKQAADLWLNQYETLTFCAEEKKEIEGIIEFWRTIILDIQEDIYETVEDCVQNAHAQSDKHVRSVKKREVDYCEQLEKELKDKTFEFTDGIIKQINDDIQDSNCKKEMVKDVESIKVFIVNEIGKKNYIDGFGEGIVQDMKEKLDKLFLACKNISFSDEVAIFLINVDIFEKSKAYLPEVEDKLKELSKNCMNMRK